MIGVFAGRVMVGELATISWVLGIVGSSIGLFCMHYFESVWLPAKPQVHQYRKVDYNNFAFFTLAYYFLYVFNTSKGLGIFTYMLCIGYVLCVILLLKGMLPIKMTGKYLKTILVSHGNLLHAMCCNIHASH